MARIVVFFVFLAFLNFLSSQVSSPLSIKIGMMFPTNASTLMAYENTAGAATVALDRALKEKLFPEDTNFTIIWKYEECVEYTSAGYSFELINEENVDVLFAPPCTDGALLAGDVGTYYNIPVMLWGQTFDSRFADTSVYSTVLSAVSNYNDMASVICALMKFYEWDSFALIYQINEDGTCDSFQQDMESVSQNADSCVISYKEPLDSWAESDIQYTLNNIKSKARIVMLCFDDVVQERRFALKLSEANLNSTEYVYLLPNSDMKLGLSTKTTPWWIDTGSVTDGKDADAQSIAMRSLVITVDTTSDLRDLFTNFSAEVMAHMKSWPFYCSDCDRGQGASPYSATLYDSMYMYTLALSKIINSSGFNSTAYRNGKLILQEDASIKFEGMSGTIEIGADGIRNSLYFLMTYDANGNLTQQVSVEVSDNGVNATALYDDASTTIWKSRQGIKPLSTPKCGFDGKSCPVDIFAEYKGYVIGGVIGAILIIALSAYGIFYIFSLRTKDIERQNKLWQISVQGLTPITGKNKMLESMRSLQSGPSTNSSKYTFDSVKSNKFFQVFVYRGERVVGIQHGAMARLDKAEMAELRNMQRIMDHENVNRFIGITIDGSEFISIWRYCSRGTLQDILGSRTFTLDGFFMYSLIRDLSDGLAFIHSSFLECHGYLKSTNCLVDDRWQIKISDYGLKELRTLEKQLPVESLWTAPEVLRGELEARNKAADVYSFAIICSEIVNMKPPWEPREFKGPEEIVYLVKKGGRLPARPPLEPASTDLSPALMHLIKDCWSENPNDRPKVETIKTLLKSMNTGKSANLMDHVFNMLESYAVSLEEEVEERTKELIEEKKKSDILLYRMLPKQVAEKLKLGQSVEPETFECVTVFFSDVVSFTTLAARCTPLQVVNLLNTLYTTFDSIIGEHDVYKVETIGDGYLCVSGLPHRNGNEHARNIADMSLALIKSLDNFSIPHLPGEHVAIRIGIHTGGCVAGVVGLAMPRFCLFGDTINTASRMESNGKPNKIQLSFDANQFLTKVVGGYITQSRGEVIIKGKGVMETFWLVGKENDLQTQQAFYDREAAAAGQPKANKPRKEEDRISIESLKN